MDACLDEGTLDSVLRVKAEDIWRSLSAVGKQRRAYPTPRTCFVQADTFDWLSKIPPDSFHAIVTDPPYGVIEYEDRDHAKLRTGRGGVWRIPPSFDGSQRAPLPRFTVLSEKDILALHKFFLRLGQAALRTLVPGGHLIIASNPLLSTTTFHALQKAGLEKRGEIIRLVQTLRGGDRPKGAEDEFWEVSVMARSAWEPWGMFRKPMAGTVADNLRTWGTGGLRRISEDEPFRDVISCSPTRKGEREIAPHPSLKPQRFMRQLVRASLPLGVGVAFDPFAGSGSTLAAAESVGYYAIGTERDAEYFEMGCRAVPELAKLTVAP
jgi:site-specific DNA-methyltransferase (adenine-specific)